MSERKNIKRNATRPNAKRQPYVQGRGTGKGKEAKIEADLKKLDSWLKL